MGLENDDHMSMLFLFHTWSFCRSFYGSVGQFVDSINLSLDCIEAFREWWGYCVCRVPTLYYRLLFCGWCQIDASVFVCLPLVQHLCPYRYISTLAIFSHHLERYGMTEVGIAFQSVLGERRVGSWDFNRRYCCWGKIPKKASCDGEIGELWHRGSSVITEYLNKPEQTALTIKYLVEKWWFGLSRFRRVFYIVACTRSHYFRWNECLS